MINHRGLPPQFGTNLGGALLFGLVFALALGSPIRPGSGLLCFGLGCLRFIAFLDDSFATLSLLFP